MAKPLIIKETPDIAGDKVMSSPMQEVLLMLGMFAAGSVAGYLSRWGPLSGLAALAFPLVFPALGIWLTSLFC